VQGIIFVVDSKDKERIGIAKEELHRMLAEEELKDAAVLVYANKQDLRVMSVSEIAQRYSLANFRKREWFI